MSKYKINGIEVEATSVTDAVKKVKDSPASDIVKEIKAAHPEVKIKIYSGKYNDTVHYVELKFYNYPGEHATGFGNDPRTKLEENWTKFLQYLYNKYVGYGETIMGPDALRIFERIKDSCDDSVNDGGQNFEYAAEELYKLAESYVKWYKSKSNPNRDGNLQWIAQSMENWSKQVKTRNVDDSVKDSKYVGMSIPLRIEQKLHEICKTFHIDYDIKNGAYEFKSSKDADKVINEIYKQTGITLIKSFNNIISKNEYFKDSVKDMPLMFRPNTNISALEANMKNFIETSKFNSLKSNLDAINADLNEIKEFEKNDTFINNPNLKSDTKKFINKCLKILNSYPDDREWQRNNNEELKQINRIVSNLSASLTNVGDSVKDSIVECPDMTLQEMKNYCDMYHVQVSNTGVKGKYKIEGPDAEEVINELKADGYIQDSVKDEENDELSRIAVSKTKVDNAGKEFKKDCKAHNVEIVNFKKDSPRYWIRGKYEDLQYLIRNYSI